MFGKSTENDLAFLLGRSYGSLVQIMDNLFKYKEYINLEMLPVSLLWAKAVENFDRMNWASECIQGGIEDSFPAEFRNDIFRMFSSRSGMSLRFSLDIWWQMYHLDECGGQLIRLNCDMEKVNPLLIKMMDAESLYDRRLIKEIERYVCSMNEIRFCARTGELEFNGLKKPFVKNREKGMIQLIVLRVLFSARAHRVKVETLNRTLSDYFDERDGCGINDNCNDPRKSKSVYNARDNINDKFRKYFQSVMSGDFDLIVISKGYCSLSDLVKVKRK